MKARRNDARARQHPAYWAFVVHRVSGVALAAFLPVHFWALGLALEGEAVMQRFLAWTDHPLVQASEIGLVLLLAAHMAAGVRLLLVEFTGWADARRSGVALLFATSVAFGLVFALNLV
jgi:fumarate reductase subunit D